MNRDFWHADDDEVLRRYLDEHSYSVAMATDGATFVMGIGDADLLPDIGESTCAVCGTPVRLFGDAGWRHLEGIGARDGCDTPWPT